MSVSSNSSCLSCILLELCVPVSHLYVVVWSWAVLLLQVLTQKLCSLPLVLPISTFQMCVGCLVLSSSLRQTPMDCRPPGSFFQGIIQARILEWVAILFSRGSPQPRDRTQVYCITGSNEPPGKTKTFQVTPSYLLSKHTNGFLTFFTQSSWHSLSSLLCYITL